MCIRALIDLVTYMYICTTLSNVYLYAHLYNRWDSKVHFLHHLHVHYTLCKCIILCHLNLVLQNHLLIGDVPITVVDGTTLSLELGIGALAAAKGKMEYTLNKELICATAREILTQKHSRFFTSGQRRSLSSGRGRSLSSTH